MNKAALLRSSNGERFEPGPAFPRRYYIFDLDGTLADIEHRRHLVTNGNNKWDEFHKAVDGDTPKWDVVQMFNLLAASPFNHLLIYSGRDDLVRKQTEQWLTRFGISGHDILRMRPHGDSTPDQELKAAWFEADFPGELKAFVCGVFDDRDKVVAMWRSKGITCFQVAPGDF